MTLPALAEDPAQRILDAIERDTGVRPDGCPWRALRDPFVARVVREHRAWSKGHEIREERLRRAVETFDAALTAVERADRKAEEARRERERAAGPVQSPKGVFRRRR